MEWEEYSVQEGAGPYDIKLRSFYFARDIIRFAVDSKFDRIVSSLFDQLVRSASSIGANLVEGSSGSSKRDWQKFLIIALKSANETKYWLCLIRDTVCKPGDREKIAAFIKEVTEISNIIGRIIVNAKRTG